MATAKAPERMAEKMIERLQQSCLAEANLGKTSCVWEETLPQTGGKKFSQRVVFEFASQVTRVGFSSVEWWSGKEFKDTERPLVTHHAMYDKYTVRLRCRWVDDVPVKRPSEAGPRLDGPLLGIVNQVREVMDLQQQLLEACVVREQRASQLERRMLREAAVETQGLAPTFWGE